MTRRRNARSFAAACCLAAAGMVATQAQMPARTPTQTAPGTSTPSAAPSTAATSPGPAASPAAEAQHWLMRRATGDFKLTELPQIDVALLEAARAMATEHLVRLETLIADWIAEEAVRGPQADAEAPLATRVVARYLNEIALWRLESLGEQHDALTLAAIESYPPLCRVEGSDSLFATVVRRWQGVPALQRATLLGVERELLRRWGRSERTLPARPPPDDASALARVLADLLSGATPDRWPAMSPALAHTVLAEGAPAEPKHVAHRCLLRQWWLRASLKDPAAASPERRAAALAAFRWGQSWFIDDLVPPMDPAIDGDGYPTLGRRFHVTGATTVRVWIDAEGRATRAIATDRKLQAAGIRGAPLIFERLFDAAAVVRAMGHAWDKPPAAQLRDGVVIRNVEFVWKLQ